MELNLWPQIETALLAMSADAILIFRANSLGHRPSCALLREVDQPSKVERNPSHSFFVLLFWAC